MHHRSSRSRRTASSRHRYYSLVRRLKRREGLRQEKRPARARLDRGSESFWTVGVGVVSIMDSHPLARRYPLPDPVGFWWSTTGCLGKTWREIMATDSLMLQTVSERPASDIRYQASISNAALLQRVCCCSR